MYHHRGQNKAPLEHNERAPTPPSWGESSLPQRKRHSSWHQKDEWELVQWKVKWGQSVPGKQSNEAKTHRGESRTAFLGLWELQARAGSHDVLQFILMTLGFILKTAVSYMILLLKTMTLVGFPSPDFCNW